MTAEELLARLGSTHLSEYMAFYALEAKERALVDNKMDPGDAYRAVWGTDIDIEE